MVCERTNIHSSFLFFSLQARIISRNKFGFSLDTEIDLIQSIFVKDAPMLNSEPLSTTLSSLSCRTDVMQLCAIIIWCGAALVVLN